MRCYQFLSLLFHNISKPSRVEIPSHTLISQPCELNGCLSHFPIYPLTHFSHAQALFNITQHFPISTEAFFPALVTSICSCCHWLGIGMIGAAIGLKDATLRPGKASRVTIESFILYTLISLVWGGKVEKLAHEEAFDSFEELDTRVLYEL